MVDVGRVTPILRVTDLAASLDYYTGVLGFTLNWRDASASYAATNSL